MALYALRRTTCDEGGAFVYVIKGESTVPLTGNNISKVFDYPETEIPRCHDCGYSNATAWLKHGRLEGNKRCEECGSLFTIELMPNPTMNKV